MFQRWKLILTNWINCYFSKSSDEQNVNIESLVTIISHLRENLNLDESKSAILEANTVEEFLCEKYPEFKFANGTVIASNDEELCLSASLLLFFVCVNSKNFDIKSAMCSKLSAEDQETILKFSKNLMECSVITVGEVQAAITEACGQDIAAMEVPQQSIIAETPPALRSMHTNTRRLQAALEAERFDRNYLQEELSRVNIKMERLLKEKEKHKLEILNLKAKISLCCGDEAVAKNAEAAADVSAKLTRQLQRLEVRLEEMQAQLDDVSYERDTYRKKVDELKNDRDKWLALSQQENARVSQLSEELESERRNNQSLKDLVTELRQHNRLNGMDFSVECDDPDASMNSLQHNSSICSEVCVNVVEVQLGEERAKIVVLQQQIHSLQVQINELNQIREADKSTLKNVIVQRENDICNLKHRINEEIEKKNNLKAHFENETTKLNNEINELEQRLKENHEYLNAIIEKKMKEIQTLQEEKLSLLHSLNNETTKLENKIKDLQCELDTEKQSRSRMKDGYENHLMKLNVKVLNRNNELVELQNSIFEKGEQIENLQIKLRNEKEAYSKLTIQYEKLNDHTNIMQTEITKEKEALQELLSQHQTLNEQKNKLQIEVEERKRVHEELAVKYQKLDKENETIKNELTRAQEAYKNLNNNYQEVFEQNNTAQTDLKKVKEAGKKLQNKYHTLHEHHKEMKVDLVNGKKVLDETNNKYESLIKENKTNQIELEQNIKAFTEIKNEHEDIIKQKNTIQNELDKAKETIIEFENKCQHLEKENITIQNSLQKVNTGFEELTNEYKDIVEQNNTIQILLEKDKKAFEELEVKYQKLEENKTIQSEIKNDKQDFIVLTNKYEDTVKQNITMETVLKKQKDCFEELLDKYQKLVEENNTVQSELQKEKEEFEVLANKYQDAVKQNITMGTEFQKQKGTFEEVLNKYQKLEEENTTVQNKLLKEKEEFEVLTNKRNITAETELNEQKKTVEELSHKYQKLEEENNTIQSELQKVKEEFEILTNKYQETVKQIITMEAELKKQKETFEELLHEYRNLDEHRTTIENDLQLKCDEELALKVELENKVQSLNDKLTESENLADKLKKTYECQIEHLNVRVIQLTNYLKEKTVELEALKKDKDTLLLEKQMLSKVAEDNAKVITNLEEGLVTEKQNVEKLTSDFESERQVLKNMVTVTESVMEDTKIIYNNEISEHLKTKDTLETEKTNLQTMLNNLELKYQAVDSANASLLSLLRLQKEGKENVEKESELVRDYLDQVIRCVSEDKKTNATVIQTLESEKQILIQHNEKLAKDIDDSKLAMVALENELKSREEKLIKMLIEKSELQETLQKTATNFANVLLELNELKGQIAVITAENDNLKLNECESIAKLEELKISVKVLETELKTRGDKLSIALEDNTLVGSELQSISEKLKNVLEEKSQIENELKDKIQKLNVAQLKLDELNSNIIELTDEKNNMKLEENKSVSKICELEDAMKVLENELQNKLETKLQEKSQLDNEVQTLTDQLNTALTEKVELENAIQEQMQKLIAVQLDNTELESKISALLDENNNLKLENSEVATKLEECKVKEIELEKNLEQAQYLANNMKVVMTAIENELKTQKDKMLDLHDENNNLKQEKEEMSTKLEEIKSTVEDLKVVQNDNTELKAAMNVLENDIQAKGNTLKIVLQEKTQVENNLQTYVVQLANILEKKTQLEKELEEASQNLAVVQHDVKELKNELAVLLSARNNLELEKKECFSTIEELQSKIDDLEAVQNVNKELKIKIDILESELQTQANTLQKVSQEKSVIQNELQTQKDEFTKLCNEKAQVEKILEEKTALEETHSAMITKLNDFVKDKIEELEALRRDKVTLQQTVGNSCIVIKTLEENLNIEKQNFDKLTSDFKSEREMLKNKVSATESVMDDAKLGYNSEISEQIIAKECLEVEKKELRNVLKDLEMKHQALEVANASLLSLLHLERKGKQEVEKESETVRDYLDEVIGYLSKEKNANMSVISALEFQEKTLTGDYEKMKNDFETIQTTNNELKVAMKAVEAELHTREAELQKVQEEKSQVENELKMHAEQLAKVLEAKSQIETVLNEKMQNLVVVQLEIKELKSKMVSLFTEKNNLELEKRESNAKVEEFKALINSSEFKEKEEISKLMSENQQLLNTIEENKTVITNLEQLIKHELEENRKLRDTYEQEKLIMGSKISLLQNYQSKAEKVIEENQKETIMLQKEMQTLQCKVNLSEQDSIAKDGIISKMSKDKDAVISTISKELLEEKTLREKLEKELQSQKSIISELRNNMEIRALKKENEQLIRAIGQQETFTALCQEKATGKYTCHQDPRETHQVDSSSSDNTHSSVESLKTITDLEKIIHDKNRTITTLQTDITYLKSLMAESETKVLDITKELEISKDNVQQLSNQLKKIVNQKNEELADLKKQVTKMSTTENRATQIIKVSAKYQAMILKRVAEIKSNTVLKELTNFGNTDSEVRRSLAGSITMEDLENFLETTDRHLKRCSEKQIALQKERDRLTEVNRIHESEIINLKKFLTELSVSFQTFSSVKDLYGNKLSRVISVQRTVRREILNLDGRIKDGIMCKLERGYGAAMQDLAECTMNLERWVERCISRTVSVEKIKQAFTSDTERSSLASPSFQNTGLEVQLEELEKLFHKLLEEVLRAAKNEGGTETQVSTVMEVRAEYEDKLNRMKAKMKELFNEQMALLKNKQKEDVEVLERELQKTRSRMEDSKRAYESHIKTLTKELWTVGEKFLVKNDEAEWLRRNQRSGSLMSLQHVHSSGLFPPPEPASRPSDAQSLRSLHTADNPPKGKREGRGLHMSDEEGEVFDNRCLKELANTPRREPPGQRLSELKWRNSLCPPHLKSSYPAETQFAATLDEEDLKATASAAGARGPRKEVGITAYKKPGPPTPSKQAGRLSATDSELRESLRVEAEPHTHTERKTSTPARFRAFLRLNKHDSNDGTPRTRRLSNIFRKK